MMLPTEMENKPDASEVALFRAVRVTASGVSLSTAPGVPHQPAAPRQFIE